MGMPALPVAKMTEYVEQVRGLLSGEDVLYKEGKYERWIRLLTTDRKYGCINIDDHIPIHIASNAPKALAATHYDYAHVSGFVRKVACWVARGRKGSHVRGRGGVGRRPWSPTTSRPLTTPHDPLRPLATPYGPSGFRLLQHAAVLFGACGCLSTAK